MKGTGCRWFRNDWSSTRARARPRRSRGNCAEPVGSTPWRACRSRRGVCRPGRRVGSRCAHGRGRRGPADARHPPADRAAEGRPRRASDIEATNRLRIDGTRNLLDAAINAGARRFVVGSFAMLSASQGRRAGRADRAAAAAVRSMETQVLDATRRGAIEGVILRYGMFYGADAPSTVSMIEMVRKRRAARCPRRTRASCRSSISTMP